MNKKQKSLTNKGFSLVELIIVIAIMAVLVGVLAPQFLKYVERSRKSTDVQNVASIVTALQTYAADPMVDSTKALEDGTITLTVGSADVDSSNCTGHADEALKAAGITSIGLKSGNWTATNGNGIELGITVGSDGSVTIECNTTLDTDNDIMAGEYK